MFDEKYVAVTFDGNHEVTEMFGSIDDGSVASPFRPIWDAAKWAVEDYAQSVEFYRDSVHFATLAKAPNGKVYYRRLDSLRMFEI
jgi:hypothetical protein